MEEKKQETGLKLSKEQLESVITEHLSLDEGLNDVFNMVLNGLMYSERKPPWRSLVHCGTWCLLALWRSLGHCSNWCLPLASAYFVMYLPKVGRQSFKCIM